MHGGFENEGIKMFVESEVLFEETVSNETAIEKHLQEIVGFVMVEDHSLSVSSWIITDSIN